MLQWKEGGELAAFLLPRKITLYKGISCEYQSLTFPKLIGPKFILEIQIFGNYFGKIILEPTPPLQILTEGRIHGQRLNSNKPPPGTPCGQPFINGWLSIG